MPPLSDSVAASIFRSTAVTNTATLVNGKGGALRGWSLLTTNAVAAYIKFYDASSAADVTVGTTTPIWTEFIPASGENSDIGDLKEFLEYTNGLVIAVTTEAADSGTTAPASLPIVQLAYT